MKPEPLAVLVVRCAMDLRNRAYLAPTESAAHAYRVAAKAIEACLPDEAEDPIDHALSKGAHLVVRRVDGCVRASIAGAYSRGACDRGALAALADTLAPPAGASDRG